VENAGAHSFATPAGQRGWYPACPTERFAPLQVYYV
jgi:hypothetical protein